MRPLFAFVLLLTFAFAGATEEVKLRFLRPSRVLAMLASGAPQSAGVRLTEAWGSEEGGLLPKGVRIKADDARGVLIVYGSAEDANDIRAYVSLFDVQARMLSASVDVVAPLEKYRVNTQTTLKNNSAWEMADGFTGAKFKILVRMNDDSSLSIYLTPGNFERPPSFVLRANPRQSVDIVFDDMLGGKPMTEPLTVSNSPTRIVIGKPKPESIVVTIKIGVVEDPPTKKS